MSQTTPTPHDQPIPRTLVGKLSGWSAKALHYPIFSPTWFAYRARGFAIPIAMLSIVLIIIKILIPKEADMAGFGRFLFLLWTSIIIALFLGRWMAVKTRTYSRKHAWLPKKEAIAISICIALNMVMASTSFMITERILGQAEAQFDRNLNEAENKENTQSASVVTKELHQKTAHHQTQDAKEMQRNFSMFNGLIQILVLLWLCGIFDLFAYFRQEKELKDAELQEKIEHYKSERTQAEMRLSVLASQIEPHFLFNTLSGVRAAMLSDPERGVTIIDHLVAYLRSTIPQMRSDGTCQQSTVQKQFESLRAYLGVIQMRIPRLSFTVQCPPNLLNMTVPPLMLITLVENAVKHGIEPKKGVVSIDVNARVEMVDNIEKLVLNVKDNGVGFGGTSSGSGIGLTNIRERLKQLYGNEAELQLHTNATGGIEASIYLPVEKADEEINSDH